MSIRKIKFSYHYTVRLTPAMGVALERAVEDGHADDRCDLIRDAVAEKLEDLGIEYDG